MIMSIPVITSNVGEISYEVQPNENNKHPCRPDLGTVVFVVCPCGYKYLARNPSLVANGRPAQKQAEAAGASVRA